MDKQEWLKYKDLDFYPDRICGCGCLGRIEVKSHHKYYKIPLFLLGHNQRLDTQIARGGRKLVPEKEKEDRFCVFEGCNTLFQCDVGSSKKYCSRSCSGKANGGSKKGKKGNFIAWNKGLTKETDPRLAESSRKMGATKRKNREDPIFAEENSRKHSLHMKRLWQDPDYVAQQIKSRSRVHQNKSEQSIDLLLQNLFPNEYKFVGDGEFILAGKCPDFTNINGQKKIIELFGDYWHGEERTGVPNDQHAQERIDLFVKYGYQTLIIWGHELENKKALITKIKEFHAV